MSKAAIGRCSIALHHSNTGQKIRSHNNRLFNISQVYDRDRRLKASLYLASPLLAAAFLNDEGDVLVAPTGARQLLVVKADTYAGGCVVVPPAGCLFILMSISWAFFKAETGMLLDMLAAATRDNAVDVRLQQALVSGTSSKRR